MSAVIQSNKAPLFFNEVVAKYPEVSRFVILKTDVQRRGVTYTERALAQADRAQHLMQARSIFHAIGEKSAPVPVSLLMRDGTSILAGPRPDSVDTYQVDFIDGRLVLVDEGEILEEVEYWLKPDFVEKLTSSGRPMWQIATPRPQRMDISPYSYCHYWDDGKGCKYCNIAAHYNKERKTNNKPLRLDALDMFETVREAIRQPGRFATIGLTCGSILGGNELFADEVDVYIEALQAIGENFTTRRFPSQLVASAFSPDQLARIYEQTGLLTYTSDIEVLDEEKFKWICPGKATRPGYREWKRRLVEAVQIFGRGYVNTAVVGGVEMATPHGFVREEDGLRATLDEAEELASQGVVTISCVWVPNAGSVFHKQKAPSLEYFVLLAKGLDSIRRRHGLIVDMDSYRMCGNHPDTDLSRI